MSFCKVSLLSTREWVLTNRLGGYALGYGDGIHKRKYNGLLIAATGNLKRFHLLSSLEEEVEIGDQKFFLDSNHCPNCIYPEGYEYLLQSRIRPYPAFLYSGKSALDSFFLLKEIFLIQEKNAVVVKFSNTGKLPLKLALRPKLTLRNHHFVNPSGFWNQIPIDQVISKNQFSLRRTDLNIGVFGYWSQGEIFEDKRIYKTIYYPQEALRGYDSTEDLLAPVRCDVFLSPGKSVCLVVSGEAMKDPFREALAAERFYKKYPLPKDCEEGDLLFSGKDYLSILKLAAEDFLVEGPDIIAGYPWFGCWGRDTLIAMEGLKHLSAGKKIAVQILERYGNYINGGMLPNTFGEGGEGKNYDSVDAPLWYLLRVLEYAPKSKSLFERCSEIILHYLHDKNHPFFMAEDGLIEIRKGNHALTWMDAKVYGDPVTPRFGKPVEINALWWNALQAILEMAKNFKRSSLESGPYQSTVSEIENLSNQVQKSLQKFLGPTFLADRLEENDRPIWEIRPNGVIAASLPWVPWEMEVQKNIWKMTKEKLLTPYGLRSLDPEDPAYKQKYVGSEKQRDLAYHQGTVWTYLLLPFAKLTRNVFSAEKKEWKKEVAGIVWSLRDGFMKGGRASVAEIWDGTDPLLPKGCPAQAWSVFALLEIEQMLLQKG